MTVQPDSTTLQQAALAVPGAVFAAAARETCRAFPQLTRDEILNPQFRLSDALVARQTLMFVAVHGLGLPMRRVATFIPCRRHTVYLAVRVIEKRCAASPTYAGFCDRLAQAAWSFLQQKGLIHG